MGELLVGRSEPARALVDQLAERAWPVVLYGEAGVGKTALVRAALGGRGYREGGCLATLSWSPYLPLRRAFGPDLDPETWDGDAEYVAEAVTAALGEDILFVDDAQWADQDTVRVLELLAATVPLVLTVRRGDQGAAALLARIAAGARIDLEPLDGEDAAELVRTLRPRLTPSEVAEVVDRSGGNPLLIEELADADRGTESLHRAMLARCRDLPEQQLEGLALMTLAGRPLPERAIPGAEGLIESGLARSTDGYVAMRHALVREVVGELISEERRIRCHQRLAEVLTHPGEQAVHLQAAGDCGAAYDAAMRAVEEAATTGERVAHLQTAARCVGTESGAEFRLQAAEAANEIGECDTAAALLDGLPDRADLRFRIARQRTDIAYFRGDAEAHRAALAAQVEAATPGTIEELLTLVERSFLKLVVDSDVPAAAVLAEQALALAERIDEGHVAALKAVADAYYLGSDPRWRDAYPAALQRAQEEGDFARECRIANNYISATETYGPQSVARELARTMALRCADAKLLGLQRTFDFRRVNLAAHACEYDVVLAEASTLAAAPTGLGVLDRTDLLFTLAIAQVDLGLVDLGLETTERIESLGSERGHSNYHLVRSWAFLELRRHDDVLVEEKAFREYEHDLARIAFATPVFAWAARETGAPHPTAPDVRPRGLLGGALREVDAIALLREEEYEAAAVAFANAAAAYEGTHQRAGARCRWAHGEALRLAGDPAAAAALVDAEAHARGLRLVHVVSRCERSLRALGVRRSAATTRTDSSPLTARELEIVMLAAEGLTDKAIAARLGIAHRTVQTLVANARRKVGAENRRHLISLVSGG
ncbi:helix-turn-helix transcriptional regulator [Nocardioides panacisoli]|uniref:HTH luxR-type domain-containing protein n=1 Tax=Nocardioides panacisoli TaxID=627624 RepID=A0ABP7IUT5_9ACTN